MRLVLTLIPLLALAAALPAEEMRLSFILDEASDWCEACRVFQERVERQSLLAGLERNHWLCLSAKGFQS
jgi:hypothetical protein